MVVILDLENADGETIQINQQALEDDPQGVALRLKITMQEFGERFPNAMATWSRNRTGRPQHNLLD